MSMMRLDKFLAKAGMGTRTEVKQMIRKGRVTINGQTAKGGDQKTDPEKDLVCLDEKIVQYEEFEYFMLNKPAGCVSATRDRISETVMKYIPSDRKGELFPVGRLDKDTEGLLLITNDGELAHRLLSPGKHVDKTYYAEVSGRVTEEDVRQFKEGLSIGEPKKTMPSKLHILSSGEVSCVEVTIQEGKFHQVKRMFLAVGKEVLYLKRISMGSLVLDQELKPGMARPLSNKEIQSLKSR